MLTGGKSILCNCFYRYIFPSINYIFHTYKDSSFNPGSKVKTPVLYHHQRKIMVSGFPTTKSGKPKSVDLNELVLKTFCPMPGIDG